jgi:S-adenosylmethionine uptake transporter
VQALWMLVASLGFALMGALIKLAADRYSLAEIVVFRGLPTLVLMVGYAWLRKLPLRPDHWRLHAARNGAGQAAMWMSFYALAALPLATATTLNYTAPLFIAIGLMVFYGLRPHPARLAAIAIGFVGVVLLLRPTLAAEHWLPGLVGLVSGAVSAVAYLQIRALGRAGEPEWRTVLYFSLSACVTGLIAMPFFESHAYTPGGVALLTGVGLAGLVGQWSLTRAFGRGSTLLSASLQYTTIVFAAIWGIVLWNDRLPWMAWTGMALIVASGLLSTFLTAKLDRK